MVQSDRRGIIRGILVGVLFWSTLLCLITLPLTPPDRPGIIMESHKGS